MAMALNVVGIAFSEFRDGVLDGGEAFDDTRFADLALTCCMVRITSTPGLFDVSLVYLPMESFEDVNGLIDGFGGE